MFQTEAANPVYNNLRKQQNDSKKNKSKNSSDNKESLDNEPILLNDIDEILKEMRFGNVGHGLVLDKKV